MADKFSPTLLCSLIDMAGKTGNLRFDTGRAFSRFTGHIWRQGTGNGGHLIAVAIAMQNNIAASRECFFRSFGKIARQCLP